jgi:hypothetical protein
MGNGILGRLTKTFARIDRTQLIAVLAWISLALGVQVLGAPLEMFTRYGPGPGFFLKSLSAILLLLAILQGAVLVGAAKASPTAESPDGPTGHGPDYEALSTSQPAGFRSIVRFVLLTCVLLGYAWFLPILGFFFATSLLCWATLTLLGRHPFRALVEAVIAAFLLRYAFTAGLGVPLPQGQLEILRIFGG